MAGKIASDAILAYTLIEPDRIAGRVDVIAGALFGMRSAVDGARSLTSSPLSALVHFSDGERIFRTTSVGVLPPDANAAQKIAERFIVDGRKRLGRGEDYLAALFPPLAHESTRAIRSPRSIYLDHWVSLFSCRVVSGIGPPAPVMNGVVEIRVGAEGRIVGLTSTWRPLAGTVRSNYVPPPVEAPDAALVYLIEGSQAPQRFLAPYYLSMGNDGDGLLWPASGHSLVVDVNGEETGDEVALYAAPRGGSGSYRFAWGMWRLTSPNDFSALGTDRQVRIPRGTAANVIVDVEDTSTRALVRVERLLFANFGQVSSRA